MKILRITLSWLLLLLFFSACGLDTFYYLNPPVSMTFIDEASSVSNDPTKQFVSFKTASNTDSADVFQGTSVYYKIFNSTSQLLSNKTSIENIDSEYTNQGIERLISWGYKPLTTDKVTTANLVPAGGVKLVSIRLYNQTPDGKGNYEYPAAVEIDGQNIGVPERSVENKTFSFSTTAESNSIYSLPLEGQEDVNFSASAGTTTWYVALYAVSTGMSPSLTPVYSQAVYLGSLAIVPSH
jgi:hypothetical protein